MQPLIMPKLGAYTEDVLLAEWLVEEGEEVDAGRRRLRARDRQDERRGRGRDRRLGSSPRRSRADGSRSADDGRAHRRDAGRVRVVAAHRRRRVRTRSARRGRGWHPVPRLHRPRWRSDGRPGGGCGVARHCWSRRAARPASAGRGAGAWTAPARLAACARRAREARPHARRRARDRRLRARWPHPRPRRHRVGRRQPMQPARTAAGRERSRSRSTIPLRGRRGTIADRMVSSLQTAAQLTSVLELDVKPLVDLRSAAERAGATPRIGVTAIVVKLVAAALREHPMLNARVTETRRRAARGDQRRGRRRDADGAWSRRSWPAPTGSRSRQINERIAELAGAHAIGSLDAGRSRRRHVHRLERRHPPCRHHDGDPQSAAGRDPLDRPYPRPPDRDVGTARSPSGRRCRHASPSTIAPIDGGPAAAFLATLESLIARLPTLRPDRRAQDAMDDRAANPARPLPDDAHDPALRAAGGARVPHRRDPGLRAHVRRRGGRRRRRLREPRRRRLRHEHPSRPRPLHRQGLRPRAG